MRGTPETRKNLVTSIYLAHDELEAHVEKLRAKYEVIAANEVRFEEIQTDDAELLLVGYGIVSRVLHREDPRSGLEGGPGPHGRAEHRADGRGRQAGGR